MIDNAILSLYAKGMTVRNIQATLLELYHVEVSNSLISKVTEAVNEEVEQWRDRPLEAVYPVVWLDGIVVKVHQGKLRKKGFALNTFYQLLQRITDNRDKNFEADTEQIKS